MFYMIFVTMKKYFQYLPFTHYFTMQYTVRIYTQYILVAMMIVAWLSFLY